MKRFTASLFATALGVVLLSGGQARASIGWTYDWSTSSSQIISNNPLVSWINMTNQPNNVASNNSDIIATQLSVHSTNANDDHPDSIVGQNYALQLVLKDTASGASTTLLFTGTINGTISEHTSNTTNIFNSPTSYTGIVLGTNVYDVTVGPYTNPGPGGGLSGSIGAHVNVHPEHGVGQTPEPSSMLLGCLGFSFAGFAAWRKRGRKQTAAALLA
jgi:hypothetical protein